MKIEQFLEGGRRAGIDIQWVEKFSQKNDFISSTIGADGVCAALTAVWLRFRHDITEREQSITYIKSQAGREEVMALSLQYMKAKTNEPFSQHLGAFGYRAISGIVPTADLESVKRELALPGYYLVGFDGAEASHQIAVDGLSFFVFDPNYGVFKLKGPQDTAKFVSNLIKKKYPKMSDKADYYRYLKL